MDETTQSAAEETVETTETPAAQQGAEAATTTEQAAPPEAGGEAAKTALEAITAGLAEAGPRRIESKAEETPEAKEAREAEEDKEADAKGQVRDPQTGKFRALTDEEKAAKEAAKAEPAKKPDAIEDEIPADVKGRTRERMQELIKTVKEQAVLAEQHNALFGAIQETGATPDEFATMITYMKAAHSNDATMLQKAYQLLQSELRGLATRLGQPVAEVNLLNEPENKDIADEVRAGKLSLQRAHELAAARAAAKARTDTAERATKQTQEQERIQAVVKEGRTALDALEVELSTRDGAATYRAKYDILVPQLKNLFSRLDPKQWKETFRDCYDNLKLPPAQFTPPPPPKQQPLRPKQPAGSGAGTAAPKSALEAISQALDGV